MPGIEVAAQAPLPEIKALAAPPFALCSDRGTRRRNMAESPSGSIPEASLRLGPSARPPEARRGRGATATPTSRHDAAREGFQDGDWEADAPGPPRTPV